MSAVAKLYTAEDLERLSVQGCRYELIQGELRTMSPTGGAHGNATDRLAAYARMYIDEAGLGECFAAETGFVIASAPDTVLAPDWAFIAEERLPDPIPDGYVPVVPDIVAETRSPNDTRKETAEKIRQWLQAGVRMVLELDPKARRMVVYRPGLEPKTLEIGDEFSGEDVLPGFSLPIAKLFRRTKS